MRRVTVAAAAVAMLVLVAVPRPVVSDASWFDVEWVSGVSAGIPNIGTLDCDADGTYSTRGSGEFVVADVLAFPNVATAGTITVVNDGTDSTAGRGATEVPPGSDKYYNALDLALLNQTVQAGISTLTIPANTDLGVLGQFAEARSDGYSAGASGLITESGGLVELEGYPEEDLPMSGSFSLSALVDEVEPDAGPLVGSITELGLRVGAVGGAAALDACGADWAGTLEGFLKREYLISALELDVESPLVHDLVGLVQATIDDLTALLADPKDEIESAVELGLDLGGRLGADATATVATSTASLTALSELLDNVYADDEGIVSIDLAAGSITIDLATLVGGPSGLNGLAPNTELLVNAAVLNALTNAVLEATADILGDIDAAVATVLGTLSIDATVNVAIDLLGVPVATVHIPDEGVGTVHAIGLCALTPGLCGLLAALTASVAELGSTTDVLTGLVTDITDGLIAAVAGLGAVTSPVVEMLGLTLSELFGVDGLVALVINAQNQPQPANANPVPPELAALPAGQYDIAVVYLGVPLDAVDVFLGRASVGVNARLP